MKKSLTQNTNKHISSTTQKYLSNTKIPSNIDNNNNNNNKTNNNNNNNNSQPYSNVDDSLNNGGIQHYHIGTQQESLLSDKYTDIESVLQNLQNDEGAPIKSDNNVMDQFCNSIKMTGQSCVKHKCEQQQLIKKQSSNQFYIQSLQQKLLKTRRKWLREKMKKISSHMKDQHRHNLNNMSSNEQVSHQLGLQQIQKNDPNGHSMGKDPFKYRYPPKPHKKLSLGMNKSSEKPANRKFTQQQTTRERHKQKQINSTLTSRKNSSTFSSQKSGKYGKYNKVADLEQRICIIRQSQKIGRIRKVLPNKFKTSKFTQTEPIIFQFYNDSIKNYQFSDTPNDKQVEVSQCIQNCNLNLRAEQKPNPMYKKVHKQKKNRIKILSTQPQEHYINLQFSYPSQQYQQDSKKQLPQPQSLSKDRPLSEFAFVGSKFIEKKMEQLCVEQIHYFLVDEMHRLLTDD